MLVVRRRGKEQDQQTRAEGRAEGTWVETATGERVLGVGAMDPLVLVLVVTSEGTSETGAVGQPLHPTVSVSVSVSVTDGTDGHHRTPTLTPTSGEGAMMSGMSGMSGMSAMAVRGEHQTRHGGPTPPHPHRPTAAQVDHSKTVTEVSPDHRSQSERWLVGWLVGCLVAHITCCDLRPFAFT